MHPVQSNKIQIQIRKNVHTYTHTNTSVSDSQTPKHQADPEGGASFTILDHGADEGEIMVEMILPTASWSMLFLGS